jgi:hypothetical protein
VIPGAACDALEQKLDAAAIDPVALHQKTDQGIFNQFGERILGGFVAHYASPDPLAPVISNNQ